MDLLEKTIKALPLFTVVLIILGIFSLTIFYSSFDVDIFSYVDTTEILLSFSNLVAVLVIFATLVFTSFLIFNQSKKSGVIEIIRPKRENENDFDYEVFKRKLKKIAKRTQWVSFFVCFILFAGFTFLGLGFSPNDYNYETLLIMFNGLTIILFAIALCPLTITEDGRLVADKSLGRLTLFGAIPFIIFYLGLRQKRFADFSRKHDLYQVSVLLNSGDTIKTNSNFAYISSTRNYLFFLSRTDSTTTIIPKSDCKRIDIKGLWKPVVPSPMPDKNFPPPI